MKRILCCVLFVVFGQLQSAYSQAFHDYGFVKDNSIPVFRTPTIPFAWAWTGGMNNMQFGWLDCNADGKKDLIAFDVHGYRVLPFLRTDSAKLEYAPQYAPYFPELKGFMQLIDFDNDGKEDIFTYHNAGIKVYRNISDTLLKFELFTEQIQSLYAPNQKPINLFCTEGDYLVIRDMDGDGDLDILAFWSLGKYVDYHVNMSVEKQGNTNHLEFELADRCWGKFSESGEYNAITLHDNCNGEGFTKQHRHTGSTMLSFDENGDGLADLLLGDMDYPNVMLLTNGGTTNAAYITSKDSLFPSYDVPIQLYSMPCPMRMDVDGDGLDDLLVSPFDLSLTKSENKNSVWFYKNTASQQNPHFTLQTTSFLQNEMLDFGSGAYPVLYDMDGDSLLDLVVGNYGYYDSTTSNGYSITSHYSASIAYFKNTGTASQPVFLFITDDLANLRQLGYTSLIPAIGDLNGNGKPDILLGSANNNLIYLENHSPSNDTVVFATPVFNYQSIQAPEYAAVQLFDLDKDGLLDLIIGARRGNLCFYKNTGSAETPIFTFQTDSLGGVNVRDFNESYFGYATPYFFRTKTDETRLFVASEKGAIEYYKQIDGNIAGSFVKELDQLLFSDDKNTFPIKEGIRTSITLGDVNNDGYPDAFIGNFAGGLSFYKGAPPPMKTSVAAPPFEAFSLQVFPNPANDRLYIRIPSNTVIQSVSIYDRIGRCCIRTNMEREAATEIDIVGLAPGVYILRIITANGICSRKFIKY
jgi:hypothetical protein